MNIYLIDYENVNEAGIKGVHKLKEGDQVHLFYSEQIKSIPFERSIELTQSKARIEFIQIHKTKKNYLDFQLSTYLGYLIGKGEKGNIHVVSKDTGFDSVIDFWKGRNVNICRQESIGDASGKTAEKAKKTTAGKEQKEAAEGTQKKAKGAAEQKKAETKSEKKSDLPEAYRKKVRAAVKDDKISPANYTAIYKAISEGKDKSAFNNALVKVLQSEKGGIVYGHLKEIFEDYQKNKG